MLTALPVRHANQAVNPLRESAPGGFNGQEEEKDEGTVEKIIKPLSSNGIEKGQITPSEADDLYREVRVENVLTDESGEKAGLKWGEEVDVIVEADSSATMKKP